MASIFQPPPTYALPVVVDEITGRSVFNPIWLRWFLDLSKGLSAGGTPSGAIVGPPTSIAGHVVLWDNATGSLLKDGGQLGTAAYQNSTVFQPAGTYVNSVSVTAPLTSTGGVTPSLGMVNQGTATTVLHGNAAGNPSFSSVTAADAPALVPFTVPQDLQDWTGFLFPDTVQSTYDSTARTVTITSPVAGQLFYYWQGTKTVLGDGTTWTSSAHDAITGGWFLSSADGTTFTWAQLPWEFYQLMVAFVYYGTVDRFGIRETHGTMSWQTHQEFHETTGTYLHAGGDLGSYTLASTTVGFRRPTVSTTTVKDEDLETINPALSSDLYTKVTLTGTGTTTFTVETADIVPLLGNNPYYNLFSTPNWTQVLMANNSYMIVWLVAVPAQTDTTSQKYRYLWIQGQQNGTLAAMRAVTSASVNVGTFASIFTEFVFVGKIIIRYTGGNWVLTQVEKLTGTRVSQASVSGGYLSAVTTDTTLTGAGTGAFPLSVVKTGPVTITADYTILDTDQWIINNKGSACVLTFPAASLWPGRAVTAQNYQAFTVTSASANIVPRGGGAATTAILAGVVGNWVTVVSDGTNWAILQAAP